MKLRESILTALLMAIGYVLHQVTPPIVAGMRPNFLLVMLFLSIFINPKPANALLAGFLGGVFAALSTTFPGGQIANIVDELITSQVIALLVRVTPNLNRQIAVPIFTLLGTMISGAIFLSVAMIVVGALPTAFSTLYTVVVLPTAAINTVVGAILYNLARTALRTVVKF
ncbi:tryptophan transporter [Thermovenabulum gondwanense]|uniref:Putative tryptophan transport protein n=1 Tax=Thermovenabulum gondwanense TaxID=520767 RepID=A0A161PVX6_9FIRM|nr:tryptophan transporter [Thermovenabulum gondwanense]KYO67271.1 putative tryptophan transport protein [Thermovenabulum gondwanense]